MLSSCDCSSCWCWAGFIFLRMTTNWHLPEVPNIRCKSSRDFAQTSTPFTSSNRSPRYNPSPSNAHSIHRPFPSAFVVADHLPTFAVIATRERLVPFCKVLKIVPASDLALSNRDWRACASSTKDNNCSSSLPRAYSNSACRMRTSMLLEEMKGGWLAGIQRNSFE